MNICPFSKYKDIFGKQNTGVHKLKFEGTSLVDYILSILGAIVLTYFTKIPLVLTTIVILLLGIIFHMLFGVQTQSLNYIGIKC